MTSAYPPSGQQAVMVRQEGAIGGAHAAGVPAARRDSWFARVDNLYARMFGPTLRQQRERAMYGERNVLINVAEYDALRHQVPNVTMMLKPIAYPDVLGLASFFAGNWVLSTWLMEWFGTDRSPVAFGPLLLIYGGIGQLLAAFRGIRARDNWASVIYATWGSFFFAMFLAFVFTGLPLGQLRDPVSGGAGFETSRDVLGMMLVPVSVITLLHVIPALARDWWVTMWLALQGVGSLITFIGWFVDKQGPIKVGAYLMFFGGISAFFRLLSYLIEDTFLKTWFPALRTTLYYRRSLIKVPIGEPGVTKGQQ